MVYQYDGIADKFRMPYNKSDQNMLATAKVWYTNSNTYSAALIAYGLPADFRTLLNDAAANFEGTLAAPVTAVDQRTAARAQMAAAIRIAMIALRICDRVMRNNYATNPGKLAAWLSASHVEREAKKKAPPTP